MGKALEWVTAVWREDGTAFPSFDFFLQRFREIFEHPEGGISSSTHYPITPSQTEPMQLGYTHLTPVEWEHRICQHLCLYCGQAGHLRASCPTRPSACNSTTVSPCIQAHHSSSCIKVPVVLALEGNNIPTSALLDSGAAGNFMSHEFAQHQLPLISCTFIWQWRR